MIVLTIQLYIVSCPKFQRPLADYLNQLSFSFNPLHACIHNIFIKSRLSDNKMFACIIYLFQNYRSSLTVLDIKSIANKKGVDHLLQLESKLISPE